MLDLFRNSWITRCSVSTVGVPRIVDHPWTEPAIESSERGLDHHPE
jgi:hypothetical protein